MEIKPPKFPMIEKDFLNGKIRAKNDIAGARYGCLHMLKPSVYTTLKGSRVWIAKCDCGDLCYVSAKNVKSGKTRSCGCQHRVWARSSENKNDYSGQKHFQVTFLEPTNERYDKKVVWKAQCDCGNHMYIPPGRVINGNTKSCGCFKESLSESLGVASYPKMAAFFKEHYGVSSPAQAPYVRELIAATSMAKWGVPHPFMSDEVQKRGKDVLMEKYGTTKIMDIPGVREKISATRLVKYGFKSHMSNPEIAAKAARNSAKTSIMHYWKDDSELVCQGSYEIAFVKYMNEHKVEFLWQIPYRLKAGNLYFIDAYLVEDDTWVEIKGWFRDEESKLKWEEFHAAHANSELWEEKLLKVKGIL